MYSLKLFDNNLVCCILLLLVIKRKMTITKLISLDKMFLFYYLIYVLNDAQTFALRYFKI